MKVAKIRIKDWEELEKLEGVEAWKRGLMHKGSPYQFNDWMYYLSGLELVTIVDKEGAFEIDSFIIDKWMYEIIWAELLDGKMVERIKSKGQ